MKIVIILILSLGLAQVASAGLGDFFKTKEISKRMLNLVLKNHLYVAKVTHPVPGIKLFDACFDGEKFLSKSSKKANRCVEREWRIDEDDKGSVFPHEYVLTDKQWVEQGRSGKFGTIYSPVCTKFEKYNPVGPQERTTSKEVNCRWVEGRDLPFGHYAHGDNERSYDWFNICDRKSVKVKFPLTQVIEVHRLYDNFSDRVYYHISHEDRRQPGYTKYKYTIPFCQEK